MSVILFEDVNVCASRRHSVKDPSRYHSRRRQNFSLRLFSSSPTSSHSAKRNKFVARQRILVLQSTGGAQQVGLRKSPQMQRSAQISPFLEGAALPLPETSLKIFMRAHLIQCLLPYRSHANLAAGERRCTNEGLDRQVRTLLPTATTN